MRRKAANEKPSSEADHAASIAHAILASKKGYADGGSVECMSQGGSIMEAQSESGDDFLSSDADSSLEPIENAHLPDDPEHEIEGMGESRKKMLSGILASIRAKK